MNPESQFLNQAFWALHCQRCPPSKTELRLHSAFKEPKLGANLATCKMKISRCHRITSSKLPQTTSYSNLLVIMRSKPPRTVWNATPTPGARTSLAFKIQTRANSVSENLNSTSPLRTTVLNLKTLAN